MKRRDFLGDERQPDGIISGWPADAGWLPSRTTRPLFSWPWSPRTRGQNRRTHRLAFWLVVSNAVRRWM